jgi:hypothetical protein
VHRGRVYGIAFVVLALVLSPLVRDHDSFPLSTYPMFSERLSRMSYLPTAVGVTASGDYRRLSPELISGGYEPIHAFSTVDSSIARGDTAVLCEEIRARVNDHGAADIVAIEVVTETHDSIDWFTGDKQPLARTVHARC